MGSCDEAKSEIRTLECEVLPSLVRSRGTINYRLGRASHITITIYNAAGQAVTVLADKTQEAGAWSADFNAYALGKGVYFVRLDVDGAGAGAKLVVLE